MFGATTIVKNNDSKKYMYCGYWIAFDLNESWSFADDFARNVIIFGVDNNSSSHTDNLKNEFLILGDALGINGGFGAPDKKMILILVM